LQNPPTPLHLPKDMRVPLPVRTLSVFVFYFVLLLLLAFLAGMGPMQPRWASTIAEFTRTSGLGDPVSFAEGALDFARNGRFTPPHFWLIHLWPPGFMALEGTVLRLFGEDAPVLLPLLAVSAACCATWMLLLRAYLRPVASPTVATLAPLVPFLFPVSSFFLLSPVGLSLGETFSFSFLVMGFLLALLAFRMRSLGRAVLSGLALAAAAYFRSQFELLVTALSVLGIVLVAASIVFHLWKKRGVVPSPTLFVIFTCVIVANLAMAPWRYYNFLDWGSPGWVQTSVLVVQNSLRTDQDLRAAGGQFLIEGGANLACKLEPSWCGKNHPDLFYGAFFRHPFEWIADKASRVPAYWMTPPGMETLTLPREPGFGQGFANVLLLLILLAGAWQLWRIRRQPAFAMHAWFQGSLYACLLAVYLMVHLEARYMYLPKLFAIIGLITLLAERRARVQPSTELVATPRDDSGAAGRMKAVIMAAAVTRQAHESVGRPRLMLDAGGAPILWHVMKMYSAHGINDFIVCCGDHGYVIKKYFADYFLYQADVTFDMKDNQMRVHRNNGESWRVTLVDTGEGAMSSGRLERVREYVGEEDFCLTYGDGLGDVDITASIALHREAGRLATLTAVQVAGRAGSLNLREHRVPGWEDAQGDRAWSNSGMFVLSPKVMGLMPDDSRSWEGAPMEQLARDGQLAVFLHRGAWQPVETPGDESRVEQMWPAGQPA
jgi:glucose-1-phosphate cytidylyltransferase